MSLMKLVSKPFSKLFWITKPLNIRIFNCLSHCLSDSRIPLVPLMWLYIYIDKCETVATGTQMFMLFFIGTLLCLGLGSTVSLHYLWSLRDISQIKNYDWGDMAYATLL
ncbi:hypothetical protein ACB092_06G070800 [Castanea dentata]